MDALDAAHFLIAIGTEELGETNTESSKGVELVGVQLSFMSDLAADIRKHCDFAAGNLLAR